MSYFFGQLVFWHNHELIHPDDLPKLEAKYQRLAFIFYEVKRNFEGYAIIQILPDEEVYWVKSGAIKDYPFPKYKIGNLVQTKTGILRNGWIRKIDWHFKRSSHIFLLEVENKIGFRRKSKCWYFEQDLELLEE